MTLYFAAGVDVAGSGQVSWWLYSTAAAQADGVASLTRRGLIGDARPDDGSGRIQTAVLVAMECLGAAMSDLSRNIAWSYSLLPDIDGQGARAQSLLG